MLKICGTMEETDETKKKDDKNGNFSVPAPTLTRYLMDMGFGTGSCNAGCRNGRYGDAE